MDPVAGNVYNLCDSALQRLGKLTLDLRFGEYTCIDLLLGVRPFSRCHLTLMIQINNRNRTLGRDR